MSSRISPRDMLAQLVAFPTVSRDSNLALIAFVVDYLAQHGVTAELVHSPCGQKANLYATIGPSVAGGVVLSGHTDVVPVDGQDWHSDPFTLDERDGRLYGRGTCDMKAFYATALALLPDMTTLQRPIHLALSYDEETGCLGAPDLIDAIAEHLPSARAVIVGEPTELNVVTAHKGVTYFETRISGHEAHSSLQHIGVSAVMAAGRLIHWLAERQRHNAEAVPDFAATANSDTARFEPAYTSVHCGMIRGGTAPNITARDCHFVTDIRSLPGEDPLAIVEAYRAFALGEVLPQMQQVHPDTSIDIALRANAPAFAAGPDCPAVALAKQLTGQNEVRSQPYAAEAGQFQCAGFATVMCGPGSIEQAHQPNEYISIEQLNAGEAFLRRLIAVQSATLV